MSRLPNFVRLDYFLAVAETLSFGAAAQRLNVAQSAVSRAVRLLEEELGFALFERTTRRVQLTEAGAVLAQESGDGLARLAGALRHSRRVAAGEAGEIIVAYSALSAHGPMARIIASFRKIMPQVKFSLYPMASQEQFPALESNRIDIGFLLSATCRSPLNHIVIARERYVVLVSQYDPLAAQSSVALSDIAKYPFVAGTQERWSIYRSLMDHACLSAGFLPTVVEEADEIPLLLHLISLGRGVTLYGAAVVPTLPPDIVAIPVTDSHATFDASIAWKEGHARRMVHAFVDHSRIICSGDEAKAETRVARKDPSSRRRRLTS